MRVVLFGVPGAGKGTQAQMLAGRLGVPQVSSGDMFRAALREGTPMGRKARQYMDAGLLVPDDVVIGLVTERLSQPDAAAGFILDGFPRTLPQAEALDQWLATREERLDAVLEVQVPEADLVERLAQRRSCPDCGAVYHLSTRPPKQAGKCDLDGHNLILRVDDTVAVIKERQAEYRRKTEPLRAFYRKLGLLKEIDGSRGIDKVLDSILKKLHALPAG